MYFTSSQPHCPVCVFVKFNCIPSTIATKRYINLTSVIVFHHFISATLPSVYLLSLTVYDQQLLVSLVLSDFIKNRFHYTLSAPVCFHWPSKESFSTMQKHCSCGQHPMCVCENHTSYNRFFFSVLGNYSGQWPNRCVIFNCKCCRVFNGQLAHRSSNFVFV